jgi:hypothetical protein
MQNSAVSRRLTRPAQPDPGPRARSPSPPSEEMTTPPPTQAPASLVAPPAAVTAETLQPSPAPSQRPKLCVVKRADGSQAYTNDCGTGEVVRIIEDGPTGIEVDSDTLARLRAEAWLHEQREAQRDEIRRREMRDREEASTNPKIMLFGGRGHEVYLGCVSCPRDAFDSIFNPSGPKGSCPAWPMEGKDSSLRCNGAFSEFTSVASAHSACDSLARDPPVIVDQFGNYYGRLSTSSIGHRDSVCHPLGRYKNSAACELAQHVCGW